MSTVRDLIKGSLRLIGAVATGETPSAEEQADALSALNELIKSWSNEGLIIHAKVREEFTLTAGDGTYTLGTGGNFNTTRPVKIESACIQEPGSATFELPLDIINSSEWAQVSIKGTEGSPRVLYQEGTFPLETLNLYPVPSEANKLVLYSVKPLSSFASVNADVEFPPGYERALRYALAIELAPEYGKEPTATVVANAAESKTNVKRTNIKSRTLDCDPAVRAGAGHRDIYSGGRQ